MTEPTNATDLRRERNGLGDWGWNAVGVQPTAAYVHIPFCRHRCGYCNFSLMANREDLYERFLNALEIELSELKTPRPVDTLFLGGGTPSILPREPMQRMLNLLRHWLPMDSGGEWSMEANPLDVTDSFCRHVTSLGVNRLSIGGQSFQASKLKRLERDHSPEQLKENVGIALEHFESVSLDLIFAAPDEILDGWNDDLTQAVALGVQHVSTYGLTFEKGARFWGMRERHEIESVPEDLELELYKHAIDLLCQHDFEHYEISNFAKSGYSCRHNQNYWLGKPWWAFGPSAARYVGGNRSVNHRGTLEYIRRLESHRSAVDEFERLTPEQGVRERFVFGMRQMVGVNWGALKSETEPAIGQSIERAIEKHVAAGWMIWDGDQIRLSREGLFISDALWSEYL